MKGEISLYLKGTCHIGTEKKLIVNIENYDNYRDTIDNVFSEEFIFKCPVLLFPCGWGSGCGPSSFESLI